MREADRVDQTSTPHTHHTSHPQKQLINQRTGPVRSWSPPPPDSWPPPRGWAGRRPTSCPCRCGSGLDGIGGGGGGGIVSDGRVMTAWAWVGVPKTPETLQTTLTITKPRTDHVRPLTRPTSATTNPPTTSTTRPRTDHVAPVEERVVGVLLDRREGGDVVRRQRLNHLPCRRFWVYFRGWCVCMVRGRLPPTTIHNPQSPQSHPSHHIPTSNPPTSGDTRFSAIAIGSYSSALTVVSKSICSPNELNSSTGGPRPRPPPPRYPPPPPRPPPPPP